MKEDLIKKIRQKVESETQMSDALSLQRERRRRASGETPTDRPFAYKQPIPDDLWVQCPECKAIMYREDFARNHSVCQHCEHHFRISAWDRIRLMVDEDSFSEIDANLSSLDPLSFESYPEKIRQLQEKTGLRDAIIAGTATIEGEACYVAAMDSRFMMGSMGSVVGEKITRLFEKATADRLPVLLFSVSGGARMQEGIISLMQMAKTAAAVKQHSDAGLLYLSFMTDPTTGGVTASFASLGDLILSEPGTIIGFAGRRVIEGTISESLPDDFQRAEFLLEHGFLDKIIARKDSRDFVARLLRFHRPQALNEQTVRSDLSLDSNDNSGRPQPVANRKKQSPVKRSGSECLEIIRQKGRPTIMDYLPLVFDDFIELHGDRYYADDPAIWGGLALLDGQPVTVIATRKGRNLQENNLTHFGMPHPEGYRKALRLMKQAEKFGRPIITFVDTPGAYCGVEDEERGQGEAIARNLYEMSGLTVPIISCVIGEGGSGGALAIAVSDRLAMLSNTIYSVISPRGFASLLWKDPSREREAADAVRITAHDLQDFGICDQIIEEPGSGAHERDIHGAHERDSHGAHERDAAVGIAADMKAYFIRELKDLLNLDTDRMLEERHQRFRKIAFYTEE